MGNMDWRSADDYAGLMKADTASLAWEFLRRNEKFRERHRALVRRDDRHSLGEGERQEYAQRWGLRFRSRH